MDWLFESVAEFVALFSAILATGCFVANTFLEEENIRPPRWDFQGGEIQRIQEAQRREMERVQEVQRRVKVTLRWTFCLVPFQLLVMSIPKEMWLTLLGAGVGSSSSSGGEALYTAMYFGAGASLLFLFRIVWKCGRLHERMELVDEMEFAELADLLKPTD